MIELNLYSIVGLYNEFFRPDFRSLTLEPLSPNGIMSLQRANSLFWAQHLQEERIQSLIDRLKSAYRYTPCAVPQYAAVIENPDLFVGKVLQAPAILANQGIAPQEFFSYIETLTILCNLYSDFTYKPFRLSVEEGFLLNEYSSEDLVQDCLNPVANPYYDFIIENCWPVIESLQPDVIWILGPIRVSVFTMAMLAREAFPGVHISVIRHSSEYYSLNKITKYLQTNELLFSVIDSIILDDDENTQRQVYQCLEDNASLESVPNLLFVDRGSNRITQTAFDISHKKIENWTASRPRSFDLSEEAENVVDPSEIVNVKLWPDARCYWNRCTFCGINQKYRTLPDSNRFADVDEKAEFIAELANGGCRYFWMIDEAVPPEALQQLAQSLLDRQVEVHWQARSKVDPGFTEQVCDTLARAGLREIRLGLESGNPRILNLMDKFPSDVTLELVKEVTGRFHSCGISVHFPIIFGFPTESYQERLDTFNFLRELKALYPSTTFNINALGLDVASRLFRYYELFDITEVRWACPAKYFLGNLVDWNSDVETFDKESIDQVRDGMMRQLLYPWMPTTKMTPSYIFYRLSETSRITLVWKSQGLFDLSSKRRKLTLESRIRTNPEITVSKLDRSLYELPRYRVYNWSSHAFVECDEDGRRLLETFSESQSVGEGLRLFHHRFHSDMMTIDQVNAKHLPQLNVACQNGLFELL